MRLTVLDHCVVSPARGDAMSQAPAAAAAPVLPFRLVTMLQFAIYLRLQETKGNFKKSNLDRPYFNK